MKKIRYAEVGVGGRADSYYEALVTRFSDICEIVGFCDTNHRRMEYANNRIVSLGGNRVPTYDAVDFDRMLKETEPDIVIVTTIDCLHREYIIRALEYGCDVITEKPMTIDADSCNAIMEAEKRTGRTVHVTFNCRFIPFAKRIKELLSEGIIGEIFNVDFEWLLDTSHGADYFRRWHRKKENSGGLLVHKATHHFDLVNWWLDQEPDKIYANGTRKCYGATRKERGERCFTCEYKGKCEYAFDREEDARLKEMYFKAEGEDGYYRDRCIFSDEINIEDNMSVSVRYKDGALLTYSLVAYSPYEGWKIAFTGSEGRLEAEVFSSGEHASDPNQYIRIYNRKGETITYQVPKALGSHGGGDARLLDMIIRGGLEDPLGQIADTRAGTNSVMIGVCANMSIKDGQAHRVEDLIHWPE